MTTRSAALTPWQRVCACDQQTLLRLRACQNASLTPLMRSLTHLGDAPSWVLVALVLASSAGAGPGLAKLLAVAAVLATVLAQIVKRTCRRRRPSAGLADFAALIDNPDAFSFPSGHTAGAFAVAVALAGTGSCLGALLLGLAFAIAFSRVYLGAHYPLDVGAGAAIGALSGLVARSVCGL